MRIVYCFAVVVLALGCTKKNPNACCTDPQDCSAHDLPDGTACAEGLVCRGNQCIAEACATSQDCDAAAPYCIATLCAGACSEDAQCPGFGETADDKFCAAGTCVQCKIASDCAASTPVCAAGTCRGCERPDECASGACGSDGTCVSEANISFVSAAGGASSACTRADPCTLAHALTLTNETIELLPGTYIFSGKVTITGKRTLVGAGSQTIVTSSAAGAIFGVDPLADATFDSFQISGASTNGTTVGIAIDALLPNAARTITLRHMQLDQNAANGLRAADSTISIVGTEFSGNGQAAVQLTDSTGSIDRCNMVNNVGVGINLDGGYYTVTNSFFARNETGITVFGFSNQPSHFDLNTFADNSGQSISCSDPQSMVTNSIFARNAMDPSGCTLSNNLTVSDVTTLHFRSPDLAPYDYHIGSGSVAIDGVTASTVDHDYDGDVRPNGSASDYGADEAE